MAPEVRQTVSERLRGAGKQQNEVLATRKREEPTSKGKKTAVPAIRMPSTLN